MNKRLSSFHDKKNVVAQCAFVKKNLENVKFKSCPVIKIASHYLKIQIFGNLFLFTNSISFPGKDLNFSSDCPSGNLKILCTKLRSGASKNPSVKCCVRQSNCENGEQSNISAKRLKSKSRSPPSYQTVSTNPWHQRCTTCQKRNPYFCMSVQTDAELSVTSRKHSEVDSEQSDENREHSDGSRHVHLDGSECGCTCCMCCWAIEDTAYELLERCLDLNPHTRITAAQALEHAFFKDGF